MKLYWVFILCVWFIAGQTPQNEVNKFYRKYGDALVEMAPEERRAFCKGGKCRGKPFCYYAIFTRVRCFRNKLRDVLYSPEIYPMGEKTQEQYCDGNRRKRKRCQGRPFCYFIDRDLPKCYRNKPPNAPL